MIKVMVNGLPGKMASLLVKHVLQTDGFDLIPYSLTGPQTVETCVTVDGMSVALISPEDGEEKIETIKKASMTGVMLDFWPFLTADFTLPDAVNGNADLYVAHKLPFIMGTTGGDREALMLAVTNSDVPAVIAPNMAKSIVLLIEMLGYAASKFPGALTGFSGGVVESHQATKEDTSGTAKAVVASWCGFFWARDYIGS